MKVLRYFSGISLVICSILLVTGCSDDFLDRPPLGSLDNSTWINTEDAGSKMLSMCYLKLHQLTPYQCPLPGLSFFSRRQSLCPYSLLPRIPGRCIFSFHLKSAPCPKGNKKRVMIADL